MTPDENPSPAASSSPAESARAAARPRDVELRYPALFIGSDQASMSAQSKYLVLYQIRLWLAVMISASSLLAAFLSLSPRAPLVIIGIATLLSLVITGVLRERSYEKLWFDARAVAESVKTATWRYIMHVAPFDGSDEEADTQFIQRLVQIRRSMGGIESHLPIHALGTVQITDSMRALRALPLSERREIYLTKRLQDQRDWYLRKAASHRAAADRWFWTTQGVYVSALCLTVYEAVSGLRVNVIPLLFQVWTAGSAWNEAKRHGELHRSYSLAGQELSELEALFSRITEPEEFERFVNQVEGTISREHTLWAARREVWLHGVKGEDRA
jgi:hypothetical protein